MYIEAKIRSVLENMNSMTCGLHLSEQCGHSRAFNKVLTIYMRKLSCSMPVSMPLDETEFC